MKNQKLAVKAAKLCKKLSLEDKISLLCTEQQPIESIGLGKFYIGTEVARGFVGRKPEHCSTVFPQPVGLAGTFDKELMAELGEIAGNEARGIYNEDNLISPCLWGPTVDMERNPLWGRTEEAYGEDVCLAGEMTRAYTDAMAGYDGTYVKTVPTLKHFCANNNEKDRGSCNADIPVRLKYEYYYAAFMNAIKYGGAKGVMAAYNEINGIPALCNPELDTVLKDEWGMWYCVTDGGDFSQNVVSHRYCADHAETLAEALKAGCDVMTDNRAIVRKAAYTALERGLMTEADIDRAVENVLYLRLSLGQLSEDCAYNSIRSDVRDDPRSAETNLRAAKEQIVLLKNDGLLPLKKNPRKIAVAGPLAEENLRDWYTGCFVDAVTPAEGIRREFPDAEVITDTLWEKVRIIAKNGKYLSVHEDGTVYADGEENDDSAWFELQDWGEGWMNLFSVKYKKYVSFKDDTLKLHNREIYDWFTRETLNFKNIGGEKYVIEEYLSHGRLTLESGGRLTFSANAPVLPENTFTMPCNGTAAERVRDIAENCDLVIYCTGNYPVQSAKECFDRTTLELTIQPGIAKALGKLSDLVMVLISSYPYAITEEAADADIPAILYTTHAGAHLGTAIAETICGKNNPGGRLAMTWYSGDADAADINDYDIEKTGSTYMYFKGTPLFPFGYGMSYSEFSYRSLEIKQDPDGSLTAFVTVENTSDTDGDEVIQLYFSVPDSAVSRPIKKLCAFERVHVKAHETVTAELTVREHILQIFDVRREKMITENGSYRFVAGGRSDNLPLSADIKISGETPGIRKSRFNAQFCDVSRDAAIAWSRRLKKQYLRGCGWAGTAVYGGVDTEGKSAVRLRISSVMNDETITVKIGGISHELKVRASIAYDDFNEYTIEIQPCGTTEIVVYLKEFMGLLDIELI